MPKKRKKLRKRIGRLHIHPGFFWRPFGPNTKSVGYIKERWCSKPNCKDEV